MKDLNKGKLESSSPKKFLDDVISSYYECNPKEKKNTFEKIGLGNQALFVIFKLCIKQFTTIEMKDSII